MRRVVILNILSSPNFPELLRVAQLLKTGGKYKPVLYFSGPYPTIERDLKRCVKHGVSFVTFFGHKNNIARKYKERRRTRSDLRELFLGAIRKIHNFVFGVSGPLGSYFEGRDRYKILQWFTNKIKPVLIIISDDKLRFDSLIFIKISKEKKIGILNIPAIISNPQEEAEVYLHNKRMIARGLKKKLLAFFFPRWVKRYKGVRILRQKPNVIVAMELLKIAPETPWIDNNGEVDAVAIESRAMLDFYKKLGVNSSNMKLIGSLAEDVLIKNLKKAGLKKQKLYKKLGFKNNYPLLLVILVPDMLYMPGGRPECDFKKYDKIIDYWMKSLQTVKNFNIVINLHPSVNYWEMKHLEKNGIRIARSQSVDLIPLCDLMVTSVSSVIRWAIVCAKPVLNYDVYRYGYNDFERVKGVIRVEEKKDFLRKLKKMTSDLKYLARVSRWQKRYSKQWGMLDNRSQARMLKLINKLAA